jgi:hypothetical protein
MVFFTPSPSKIFDTQPALEVVDAGDEEWSGSAMGESRLQSQGMRPGWR